MDKRSTRSLINVLTWVINIATFYFYEVKKLGPLLFFAACAVVMFVVDAQMMGKEPIEESEKAEKFGGLAWVCILVLFACLVKMLARKIH